MLKYVAESAGYTLKLFFISHTLSSVTRAHFSLSRRMLLQTRYHVSGPSGIRTQRQTLKSSLVQALPLSYRPKWGVCFYSGARQAPVKPST